ncbi:unnamed protein product, partial [Adineta steineri]
AYLPNGTEMQNLNVFRCYTCKAQSPRYFVEDLAEQIIRAEKDCHAIEREIQEAKLKSNETQKRVGQHQQTVTSLETTINEIKLKIGRLGKELRELQSVEAPNNS